MQTKRDEKKKKTKKLFAGRRPPGHLKNITPAVRRGPAPGAGGTSWFCRLRRSAPTAYTAVTVRLVFVFRAAVTRGRIYFFFPPLDDFKNNEYPSFRTPQDGRNIARKLLRGKKKSFPRELRTNGLYRLSRARTVRIKSGLKNRWILEKYLKSIARQTNCPAQKCDHEGRCNITETYRVEPICFVSYTY